MPRLFSAVLKQNVHHNISYYLKLSMFVSITFNGFLPDPFHEVSVDVALRLFPEISSIRLPSEWQSSKGKNAFGAKAANNFTCNTYYMNIIQNNITVYTFHLYNSRDGDFRLY